MRYYRKLFVLALCAISSSAEDIDDGTLVTLPEGQIKGQILQTPNDNDYFAFQEIPYAAPPVGELRFQAPLSPDKWDGVLNTTTNTKTCYQTEDLGFSGMTQTEDCLYLNVFTPVKPGDQSVTPLSVLVWIHGGAFLNGAGVPQIYSPKYFIDYGIIIVTMNYRLGPLGFLSTEDGVIPGNLGLRDQQLALQWVKNNINLFGGDSEKITIVGQSSGGISVGFQMHSRRSQGLFRAAILQSGTSLLETGHQDYARYYAFALGRSLDPNFTSDDSKELLEFLRSVPVSDISNNTVTADIGKETGLYEAQGQIWLPIIEDENLEDAFLINPFHEDVKTGNINQVPIMIGFASEEQIFFLRNEPTGPEERAVYFDNDLSNLIRNKFNMTQQNKLTAGTRLRQIYTDGTFEDDLGAVVKFSSDESFTTPVIRHAKLQSNYTDVYLYEFSYKGTMGDLKDVEVAGVQGVGHGEELGYMWGTHSTDGTVDDPEDLVIRQRLLILWSNFVKYLNPTPEEDSLLDNVTWKKVAPNNLVYLNINKTLEMQTNPKEYLKWERIIDVYAIPPLVNY